MRIGDFLYFAPELRFSDIDGSGRQLPRQLQLRIEGFYLIPAETLAANGNGFACGVLCVCGIDALALFRHPKQGVRKRFISWTQAELSSFRGDPNLAVQFYENVRNGLVHETRLKNGAEFILDGDQTISVRGGLLQINPRVLIGEIRDALTRFVSVLEVDDTENRRLRRVLRDSFSFELQGVRMDVRSCFFRANDFVTCRRKRRQHSAII